MAFKTSTEFLNILYDLKQGTIFEINGQEYEYIWNEHGVFFFPFSISHGLGKAIREGKPFRRQHYEETMEFAFVKTVKTGKGQANPDHFIKLIMTRVAVKLEKVEPGVSKETKKGAGIEVITPTLKAVMESIGEIKGQKVRIAIQDSKENKTYLYLYERTETGKDAELVFSDAKGEIPISTIKII